MTELPDKIKKYLWDIKLKKVDQLVNKEFIIERILEYGDEEAFRWLNRNYPKSQIIEVLKKSRRISPKSGNFFAFYYKIPKEKLLCIQKPFTQRQNRF